MFKKTLSAVLSLTIILTACAGIVSASAATMTVEDYAYMDIETAPVSMKKTILEAREEIIYNESWSVDGKSYVTHPDGTIEVLPKFSDLFPDWDVPAADFDAMDVPPIMTRALFWQGNVALKAPPANTMSTPFTSVPGANGNISTKAAAFGGGTVNIGYSVGAMDHTWRANIPVGSALTIFGLSGTTYNVRASTSGTPGNALMQIDR